MRPSSSLASPLLLVLLTTLTSLGPAQARPVVSSVNPPSVPPAGGSTITVTGSGFTNASGATVAVLLDSEPCTGVEVLSTETLTCMAPAGTGAGIQVEVVADGWHSESKPLLSYHLPVLISASRTWGVGASIAGAGSQVNVTAYNLGNQLENIRCRVGSSGTGTLPLPVLPLPGPAVTCVVPENAPVGVQNLQISNDQGRRWGSAAVVQMEPSWPGGKQPSDGTFTPDPVICTIVLMESTNFFSLFPKTRTVFEDVIDSINRKAVLGTRAQVVGRVVTFDDLEDGKQKLTSIVDSEPTLVGVVSGFYSTFAPALANITCAADLPFVAIGAETTILSDPAAFPCVVRLGSTATDSANAIASLLRRTRWDQGLAILTEDEHFSEGLAQEVAMAITHPSLDGKGRVGKLLFRGRFNGAVSSSADVMAQAQAIAAAKPRAVFIEAITAPAMYAAFEALAAVGVLDQVGIVGSFLTGAGDAFGVSFTSSVPAGVFKVSYPVRNSYCSTSLCLDDQRSALVHDAVQVIAKAFQPVMAVEDGAQFFRRAPGARRSVLGAIKNLWIGSDVATTGTLSFTGNNQNLVEDFGIYNIRRDAATRTSSLTANASVRAVLDVGRATPTSVVFTANSLHFPGEHLGNRVLANAERVHILVVTLSRRTDLVAARAAVRLLNEDPNVLPFSRVELNATIIGKGPDGKRDPSGAASVAAKLSRERQGANFSAMLTCCSSVALALLDAKNDSVSEAPKIGFWASSPILESPSRYPKFVRTVFSTSQSQSALLESLVQIGWRKLFVIADEFSPFAMGLLNSLIGAAASEYTNNATAAMVSISYALVDMRQNGADVRDAGLAAAFSKAHNENFTVILPLPDYDSDILHVVRAGTRSAQRAWQYVFCNQPNAPYSRVVSKTDELDVINAVQGAIELDSQPFDRTRATAVAAASSWSAAYAEDASLREPMVDAYSGEVLSSMNTVLTTPNLMEGCNQPAIAPFLYDAVLLAGRAASACDEELGCDVNNADDMMRHLRSVTVKGIANEEIKVLPGKNDVGGIPMELYSNNIISAAEKKVQRRVIGSAIVPSPKIRICPTNPAERVVGDSCQYRLTKPTFVYAGPLSSSKMRLQWDAMPSYGGLLTHYSISARECTLSPTSSVPECKTWPKDNTPGSSGNYQPFVVSSTTTMLDFPLEDGTTTTAASSLLLGSRPVPSVKPSALYEFQLHAEIHDRGTAVDTETARTNVDFAAAHPCLPVRGTERTCLCRLSQFHSDGLPREQPGLWGCRSCPTGIRCSGKTFFDVTTLAGHFITGESLDSAIPRTYTCPGGDEACPGGFRALEGMSSNLTGPLPLSTLERQCALGYAGLLCKTCSKDFSMQQSRCVRCSMDQDAATGTVLAIVAGMIVILVAGLIAAKRISRRPASETRFIADIISALEENPDKSAAETFRLIFNRASSANLRSTGDTVSRSVFLRVLTSGRLSMPPYSEKDARDLWNKLDENHDGDVSDEEFFTFFYSLRAGSKPTNPLQAAVKATLAWYASTDTKTARTVLITYFQLTSAVAIVFPAAVGGGLEGTTTTTAASQGGGDGSAIDSIMSALQPVFDFIGNINVGAIGFVSCMIGPRHYNTLQFSTLLLIVLVLLVWSPVVLLEGCSKLTKRSCKSFGTKLSGLAQSISPKATTFSAQVIFLFYPRATSSIMRSFVCDAVEGIPNTEAGGKTTHWMTDDSTIQCTLSSAESRYAAIFIYSLIMAAVVIIGCPLFQYILLFRWRYPYDRLYEATEEGVLVPSEGGRGTLGAIYALYRRKAWAMSSFDMLFKFILSGLLGVIFTDNQVDGLAFSALVSVSIAFIYIVYQPFRYLRGNQLAALAYVAVTAKYLEGAARAAGARGQLHFVFEFLIIILFFAPAVLCLSDMLHLERWGCVRRRATLCQQRCSCGFRPKHHELQNRGPADARRSKHFHFLLRDLERVVHDMPHYKAMDHALHTDGTAGKAVKSATLAFEEAVERLGRSLDLVPLKVRWQDLVDLEDHARALSALVFEGRGGGGRGSSVASSVHPEAPALRRSQDAARGAGHVVLSHTHLRQLLKTHVTQQLRNREEERGPPDLHVFALCHHAVLALLTPGANFGAFKIVRLNGNVSSQSSKLAPVAEPPAHKGNNISGGDNKYVQERQEGETEQLSSSPSLPGAMIGVELTEVKVDSVVQMTENPMAAGLVTTSELSESEVDVNPGGVSSSDLAEVIALHHELGRLEERRNLRRRPVEGRAEGRAEVHDNGGEEEGGGIEV